MEETHRRWVDSMPDAYERGLVPAVFAPFAKDLAGRAAALRPKEVLELAAGTGVLTNELLAVLPSAHVVATDLNDAMVAVGERRCPGAVWRRADAMHLPFADATFDLVVCQFGVMFFPDKPAAFAEVRRVLVDGGACILNTWAALEAHDFQAAVVAACDRLFPHDPPQFMRSVPHYYPDLADLVADVEAGGLTVLVAEQISLPSPPANPADVAAGYCLGTPVRAEIDARGGDLGTSIAAIATEIEARLGPEPVTGHMQAHVVTGVVGQAGSSH